MANIEQRHYTRLLLVPLPYEGHLNPMLRLGSILQSKGFSITIVYTDFNSPNPADNPDFSFLKIPNGLSICDISSNNFLAVITDLNRNCELPFRKLLAQKMDTDYHYKDIGCIIYDTSMYFSEAVAKHLRIPSFILYTCSATNALSYKAIFELKKTGGVPISDDLSSNMVPDLHPLRFSDLSIYKLQNPNSFIDLLLKACDKKSSLGIIWNTMEFLERSSLAKLQQYYQVPLFALGPLHKATAPYCSSLYKEDLSCMQWLDKQKRNSVIYVSLGSVVRLNEEELTEMSWGLGNSNQPFLWVVRPDLTGDPNQTELQLPEGFKEAVGDRGCIVKWAPQKEVLAHSAVGGFWSHCGWNSTIESITEGVPMICYPAIGDQKINARYISEVWKVGLQYEDEITRDGIAKAVRVLMVERDGTETRRRALGIKNEIELARQPDGSYYNSLNDLVEFIISSKPPK